MALSEVGHVWRWCVGAILLAGVALVAFCLLSPTLRLSRIRVQRQDLRVDLQEVQRVLRPLFGRHLLLFSGVEVEQLLRAAFPEIASVRAHVEYPGSLRLSFTMDPVVMRVAIHEPGEGEVSILSQRLEEDPSTQTYLTSQGLILEYPFPQGENLPFLRITDWATKPSHREHVLTVDQLATIERARDVLAHEFAHRVGVVTVYLRAREFHVQVDRRLLWFDFASPLEEQLQRYRTFLRTVPPEEALAYVDLRLHDRVVYR